MDDTEKAEATIAFIQSRLEKHDNDKLKEALAIGKFIFEVYYNSRYSASTSSPPMSFRALCADPRVKHDLGLSRRTLADYVRVYMQMRLYPPGTESLGLSHRIKLLIAQPRALKRISVEAVENNWTVSQTAEAVRASNPRGAAAKPAKPYPALLQVIYEISRALEHAEDIDPAEAEDDLDVSLAYSTLFESVGKMYGLAAKVEDDWSRRGYKSAPAAGIQATPEEILEASREFLGMDWDEDRLALDRSLDALCTLLREALARPEERSVGTKLMAFLSRVHGLPCASCEDLDTTMDLFPPPPDPPFSES